MKFLQWARDENPAVAVLKVVGVVAATFVLATVLMGVWFSLFAGG